MGNFKGLGKLKHTINEGSSNEPFAARYQITESLGEGGMGKVYLAKDTLLDGYKLALKFLHPDLCQDQIQVKRFFREAQLNRKVNHPNVVRIFDVGQVEETVYFTMEYIEGISLKEKIARGTLSTEEIVRIFKEICSGMTAIHEAGIVHRDLKPGNVMIEVGGVAKIADFGIAKTINSDLSNQNELMGCAQYIAPEIWKGKEATTKTDIYSLGVILFEMMTGKVPYSEGSPADMLRQHLCSPIPEIKNDSIPSYLKRLCYKLLSKNEHDRPVNCGEIIQKLSSATSTSMTQISRDDFIRPTVLSGLASIAKNDTPQKLTNLPDYSMLKRKTNPSTYKIPIKEVREALGNNSIGSFLENDFPNNTIADYSKNHSYPWIIRISSSLLTLLVVCSIAYNFLVPWNTLIKLSLANSSTVPFFLCFATCAIGISILFAFPAALVAAFKPAYMSEKKFVIMWAEVSCLLLGILMSLFFWELFKTSEDLVATLIDNPNRLYNILKRSCEMLLYVSLMVPKFILEDQSILYYVVLGLYAMGIFAVFQTKLPGKNLMLLISIVLLPAILYLEYFIPTYLTDYVYNSTVQTVTIPIGEQVFTMSQYALYCGLINWFGILILVNFLRQMLLGISGRR